MANLALDWNEEGKDKGGKKWKGRKKEKELGRDLAVSEISESTEQPENIVKL